jgi:hypothetical protein
VTANRNAAANPLPYLSNPGVSCVLACLPPSATFHS